MADKRKAPSNASNGDADALVKRVRQEDTRGLALAPRGVTDALTRKSQRTSSLSTAVIALKGGHGVRCGERDAADRRRRCSM